MSATGRGWQPPRIVTRTGAAHRRRGVPCQDASGVWSFGDGRQAVQLLVVSDGHGSARYDRSDVGSRLACEVALHSARELLGTRIATDGSAEEWRYWLAEMLPQQIVERWRDAVLDHARAHPRADGAPPSVVPYGATVGLLLLTPRWWGWTGLGDWDLVQLDAAGCGELLSQEPERAGGGEATFSLCMEGAARHWACRSGFTPVPEDQEPFFLLLSTDGIRKSCADDSDFLILCRYLSELSPPAAPQQEGELSDALDQISREGSGDDVSVAIASWGAVRQGRRRQGRRQAGQSLIVQPQEPAAAAVAEAGAESAAPQRLPQRGDGGPQRRAGRPRRARLWSAPGWQRTLIGLALLLAFGAAALAGGAFWLGWGPFAARQRPLEQRSTALEARSQPVVDRYAKELCSETPAARRKARIAATIATRQSQFRKLRDQPPDPGAPEWHLNDPAADPLGSLIIWSANQPGLGGPPLSPPGSAKQGPAPADALCPELKQELAQRWSKIDRERKKPGRPAIPGSAARPGRPPDQNSIILSPEPLLR